MDNLLPKMSYPRATIRFIGRGYADFSRPLAFAGTLRREYVRN
jgi:hypothetical protein